MNILYYNDLDTSKVEKNFKKVEGFLKANDFRSAEIKKIQNTDYYRARLDDTNRLLFKYAKYEGESYILLLEVIHNHAYEKSKFLKGIPVDESKINPLSGEQEIVKADIQELIFLNKKARHFHLLDKIISFDEAQSDVYSLPTPLVIIGSAGSGKTVLTLEKIKTLHGNIAYISHSSFLVENAQNIYYSNNYDNNHQEIDFLSFKEFIQTIRVPKKVELSYKNFEAWFIKHIQNTKIKEPYRLYEEFKGVLTGSVVDKANLSRDEYLNLGIKQSIYLKSEKELVYDIFTKYLKFLSETNFYDLNLLSFDYLAHVKPVYDYVVIDEVQDLTIIQLKLILSSLKNSVNFILSGDSNQIVHPNFFSWAKVKSMFFQADIHTNLLRILKTNYRNSPVITEISNRLLKIKNVRFGSIDRESTYLIDSVSSIKGEVTLLKDTPNIKTSLNSKTQSSTKFAILVMDNTEKAEARKFFKTPLIFSIHEAKGLEYENVILLNFVSNHDKEFFELTRDVNSEDLNDEIRYARSRNKEDKDLEAYKFYVNSLYVAFTRAIKNLYIIENNKNHVLFEILELKEHENQQIKIETQKSNEEEWLNEARRLDLQGKHEQAQEIRDKILGLEYLSPEAFEELCRIALDPTKKEDEVRRERKQLFRYAEARKKIDITRKLAELNFQRAILYMKEVKKAQKEFHKDCRLNRNQAIAGVVKMFGIDFRSDEEGMTGLMLSCYFGSNLLFQYFIKNEANIALESDNGQNSLQILMRSYHRATVNRKINQTSYPDLPFFTSTYHKLKTPYLKYQVDEKLIKVGNHSMEYFLVTYIKSALPDKIRPNLAESEKGFNMDEFMEFIEIMPEAILPEYRRKRQYVNSVLSGNERDKLDYGKKLFKRISRGTYTLNDALVVGEKD